MSGCLIGFSVASSVLKS